MSDLPPLPPPSRRFKHPIGVHDVAPDDEYDGYVWPLISKVMRGESVEQIADYLDWAVGARGAPQPGPA